jgi:hypothetical protein
MAVFSKWWDHSRRGGGGNGRCRWSQRATRTVVSAGGAEGGVWRRKVLRKSRGDGCPKKCRSVPWKWQYFLQSCLSLQSMRVPFCRVPVHRASFLLFLHQLSYLLLVTRATSFPPSPISPLCKYIRNRMTCTYSSPCTYSLFMGCNRNAYLTTFSMQFSLSLLFVSPCYVNHYR